MKKNSRNPQVLALNGILLLNKGRLVRPSTGCKTRPKIIQTTHLSSYGWEGRAGKGRPQAAEAASARRWIGPKAGCPQELARLAGQRGDMDLLSEVAGKAIAAAPRFPEGYVWRATTELPMTNRTKLKPI